MLIKYKQSVIPSLDISDLERAKNIVKQTCEVKGIGAYKIGFELALKYGLKKVVEEIKGISELPVIYDHQKAGTDVPFTGERFADICEESGVDAVILFPQAGPATETAWINALQKKNLTVLVGGEMTHPKYLEKDGGFIVNTAPDEIYKIALELGVKDFVVPGNKPERIKYYSASIFASQPEIAFYSPGLISQGGIISETARLLEKWHAIVGRAIYNSEDPKAAAEKLVTNLKV